MNYLESSSEIISPGNVPFLLLIDNKSDLLQENYFQCMAIVIICFQQYIDAVILLGENICKECHEILSLFIISKIYDHVGHTSSFQFFHC